MQVAENLAQVCAQNYSSTQFIVPSQGPIPGTSADTSTTGEWGGKL